MSTPCDHIFDYVAEAGLDSLEFWVETPHFWFRNSPKTSLHSVSLIHPELSPINVHAPSLDLNPCSVNPRVARISVDFAIEAIRMAGRVGADVVTVHPGRRTANATRALTTTGGSRTTSPGSGRPQGRRR